MDIRNILLLLCTLGIVNSMIVYDVYVGRPLRFSFTYSGSRRIGKHKTDLPRLIGQHMPILTTRGGVAHVEIPEVTTYHNGTYVFTNVDGFRYEFIIRTSIGQCSSRTEIYDIDRVTCNISKHVDSHTWMLDGEVINFEDDNEEFKLYPLSTLERDRDEFQMYELLISFNRFYNTTYNFYMGTPDTVGYITTSGVGVSKARSNLRC